MWSSSIVILLELLSQRSNNILHSLHQTSSIKIIYYNYILYIVWYYDKGKKVRDNSAICYSEFHAFPIFTHISCLFYLKRENKTSITKNNYCNHECYFFFTFFNKYLFKCLHLLTSSEFLLNVFSSLALLKLIILSFFVKQNLHKTELGLCQHLW